MASQVPSRSMNARGVGFFFIRTMRCVGGLARSDNDNVGVRQAKRLVAAELSNPTIPVRPWRPNNDQYDTDRAYAVRIAFRAWGNCHDASQPDVGGGCARVGSGRSARSPAGEQGGRA